VRIVLDIELRDGIQGALVATVRERRETRLRRTDAGATPFYSHLTHPAGFMDLDFSAEELAFRDQVRRVLATAIASGNARSHASQRRQSYPRRHQNWQKKILHTKGCWGAPVARKVSGGTGWSKTEQYIFEDQMRPVRCAPAQLAFGA
jgi:hypothetical protein